ncbi:MAG: hypothetical protein H6730_02310 [Deltaproteobacteria bacterium]|nr:hypothetical protein [Deltaproteobacteria bacterium]
MSGRSIGLGLILVATLARSAVADEAARVAQLDAARAALKAQDLDAAVRACRAAVEAAEEPKWGGPRGAEAWAVCADVEQRAERPAGAVKALARAARWALDAPRQRRRYLAARERVAKKAGLVADAKRAGAGLRQDILLQGILRRPRTSKGAVPGVMKKLDEAAKLYREDRDWQAVRLVEGARALVLARSGDPEGGARRAERLIARPGARTVLEVGLEALYYARLEAEDVMGAARAAVRLNAARSEDLPEEKRRYARGAELTRACRALDAAEGPGRCTRLQLELVGYATLIDYSRARPKAVLASEDLERVHADALPVLERCVLERARQDKERFAGTDLSFAWAIDAGGRPVAPEVRPRRYADDMQRCVDEAVLWIRYPRVRSQERTNVSVPYHLD